MNPLAPDILFEKIDAIEAAVYDLLLLADPSRDCIEEYLRQSEVYTAKRGGELVGVLVCLQHSAALMEIKNIAVKEDLQGQGIGKQLLTKAIALAKDKQYERVCIGTANSSIGQLYLYQKLGFEVNEIIHNFFTDNYPEPIFENGIQAKHMIILTKELDT